MGALFWCHEREIPREIPRCFIRIPHRFVFFWQQKMCTIILGCYPSSGTLHVAASQHSECWFGKALNQAFLVTHCSKDFCTMSYWDILPMPCPLISDYSRWHKNLLVIIIGLLTPFWIKLSSISSQFPYQVSFSHHLETSLRGPDTYCQHVCLGRWTRKTSWVNWHQTYDILMSHKNGEPSIQQKQTVFWIC